jgi:hypothetical protein
LPDPLDRLFGSGTIRDRDRTRVTPVAGGPPQQECDRSTIEIRADDSRRTVPIELEAYDFVPPDENRVHAMLTVMGSAG